MIPTVASNLVTSHLKQYSESLKRRLCQIYLRQFSCSLILFLGGGGGGRAVHSLFSHYATRREVPASIPGGVFGIFEVAYSLCPHSVALGSTRRLAEMSTKEFAWGQSTAGA
jgi:hypothetical protein